MKKQWVIAACLMVAAMVGISLIGVFLGPKQQTAIFDTEVGDCFTLPLAGTEVEITAVDVVSCSDPHDAQIVAAGLLNANGDRDYPSDAELFDEIGRRCPATDAYAAEGYGVIPVAPKEESWTAQDGAYVCIAFTLSGDEVTEPLDIDDPNV